MRHLTSVLDLNRPFVDDLVSRALGMAGGALPALDAVVGLLFYGTSTRTELGFAAAAARLGLRTVSQHDLRQAETMSAGESLADTIRVVSAYVDLLVVRHPDADDFLCAVGQSRCPVVSAGHGVVEHPTQALADVLAMTAELGRVDGLRLVMVGDLLHMRTAHSLALLLGLFKGISLTCVAPHGLQLPDDVVRHFRARGNRLLRSEKLDVEEADVVYVAGLPPRSSKGVVSDEVRNRLAVDVSVADRMMSTSIILCPLPRVDEIDQAVDTHPRARYFQQSDRAQSMRAAVLDTWLREGFAA